jgi:hypothetical protein
MAREQIASQLELARYTTELKPKLSSFKNSNEPSRAELLTSEFERVCELRVFRPALAECKTDRSAVLTVKSGLDPHMINKLEDGIKSWFLVVFERRCFPKCLSGLV